MKHWLRFLLPALVLLASIGSLHAQRADSTEWKSAVGFSKADRKALFVKTLDATPVFGMAAHQGLLRPFDTVTNLAFLDQSADGSHVMLAGKFSFYKVGPNKVVTYVGIIDVKVSADTVAMGDVRFLKVCPGSIGQYFRPLGVISNDGNDWCAVMQSGSVGTTPLEFYHGKMGQNETDAGVVVDSVATPASDALQDWHMTNLALAGGDLVCVVVHGIGSVPSLHYTRYRWSWSDNVSIPPRPLYSSDWGNLISRAPTPASNTDTLFGYCLRINGPDAQVGNINSGGDIAYWTVQYQGTGNPQDAGTFLSRSDLPDSQYFFAGQKLGAYQENIQDAPQPGMGGDIMFSRDGNSIAFITHPAVDSNSARWRNRQSAVWVNSGGSTQMIYNDSSAQELQPIFLQVPVDVAHFGGIKLSGSDPMVFTKADTGATSVHNLVLADTSPYIDDTINSVVLSGTNASEFSVGGTFPMVAAKGGTSITIPITFAPKGIAGTRTATATVHFANDSTRTVGLSAEATVKPFQSVMEDPALASLMSVEPNPFTASTSVRLTAQESGTLGIIVHDAVGRTIYTSELRHAGAGATESFSFDAKSLALPDGVYYITALFGEKEISRQVVLVK